MIQAWWQMVLASVAGMGFAGLGACHHTRWPMVLGAVACVAVVRVLGSCFAPASVSCQATVAVHVWDLGYGMDATIKARTCQRTCHSLIDEYLVHGFITEGTFVY